MKISKLLTSVLCFYLFSTTTYVAAQNSDVKADKNEPRIERLTFMEQFAPELVVSPDQRLAMKNERAKESERRIAVLDTLDISYRRKQKLLRDVKLSPFSDRLNKAVIVNTSFEDEVEH